MERCSFRGRKGSGHFEMIVGFMFFLGFVFFLFLFISPWSSSSLPASAMDGFYNSFSKNVTVPLSSVFVKANYSGAASCFWIDLPEELFRKQDVDEGKVFVTKLGGVNIDSDIDSGNLELDSGSDFFRVAISDEFPDGDLGSCDPLNNFELGGVVEIDVVSYSALTSMKNRYYSDYSGLKNDLRLASVFDFSIVPEGIGSLQMIPANGIPSSVDVLARDYVVKVLKANGEVSNERISIRIW